MFSSCFLPFGAFAAAQASCSLEVMGRIEMVVGDGIAQLDEMKKRKSL